MDMIILNILLLDSDYYNIKSNSRVLVLPIKWKCSESKCTISKWLLFVEDHYSIYKSVTYNFNGKSNLLGKKWIENDMLAYLLHQRRIGSIINVTGELSLS